MKAQHNKILTLIDIEAPIEAIVESTVNLARTFGAEAKFLYVTRTEDPTRTESQLSVIRRMTERQNAMARFKILLKKIQRSETVSVDYSITKGAMKSTILAEMASYRPDMVVVGKRTPSSVRLFGRQVTELVMKHFNGPLLIAHPTKPLQIKENLSLGVLEDLQSITESDVSNALIRESKKPVKLFAIASDEEPAKVADRPSLSTVNFLFENNQNAMKNLTNYVHRNNVHLMFLGRNNESGSGKNLNLRMAMKRINTSMLMVGANGSTI